VAMLNSADISTKEITGKSDNSERDQPTLLTQVPDADLILLAHERYNDNKLLEAYRLLQNVSDKTLFGIKENEICTIAIECQNAIEDLLDEPDHTSNNTVWKKQGESHGEYNTTIYYKVENRHLTCRLETPIESSLLVPLLSVLNESNLYVDWIPSWTIPFTMGVKSSKQYQRIGQVNQIVHLIANVPWPFLPREVYIRTMVIDDIDNHQYFAVRLYSLESDDDNDSRHTNDDNIKIPKPSKTVQRFDFQGVLMFRPCPVEPVVGKQPTTQSTQNENTITNNSSMIEVSFKMYVTFCR
jgi:hypothetical protein